MLPAAADSGHPKISKWELNYFILPKVLWYFFAIRLLLDSLGCHNCLVLEALFG